MTIPQSYIIFSNTNKLVLEHNPDWAFFNGDVAEVVHQFEQGLEEEILLNVTDLEAAMQQVKACYHQVIFAAGGLVRSPEGKTLVIRRLGRWDLPKGKVEANETMAAAALREVAEETGLQNIELGHFLLKTYHTYAYHGHQVIKETHWYGMAAAEQKLVPQQEEDIQQAIWVATAELPAILQDTYGNIRLVLETAS